MQTHINTPEHTHTHCMTHSALCGCTHPLHTSTHLVWFFVVAVQVLAQCVCTVMTVVHPVWVDDGHQLELWVY